MDSVRELLLGNLRSAWRRRWSGLMIAWLICGIGWAGVYMTPNQYEFGARLFVDADTILTPLLRGLAADFDTDNSVGSPATHVIKPAQPGKTGVEDRP